MKKLLPLSLLLAVCLTAASFTGLKSKKFRVEIFQHGQAVEIVNDVARLDKKPFLIRVTLRKQEGIYMSASFSKEYFGLGPDEAIPDYEYLHAKAMVESNFNEDKEIIIADDAIAYLFYNPDLDWHRFDKDLKILKKGKKVIGNRTVENFMLRTTRKTYPIADIDQDVYLWFLAQEAYERGKENLREFGRAKVKLEWK